MKQEASKCVGQNEIRAYRLTEEQRDSVEKYLDGLVEKNGAVQPRENDPLYFIFQGVHEGGLLVDLDYEEGILRITGCSHSIGNMVSYIEGARLGRLKAEGFSKRTETPFQ